MQSSADLMLNRSVRFQARESFCLRWAWLGRLLFAAVALFLPLGHPHIWRQIDTLGVSLRYWLRWTTETAAAWPLVPAILHSGDAPGFMAMEWPLLNLLAAPFFQFGPAVGTALARCFVLGLNLILVMWNIQLWRSVRPLGICASKSWRWMPLIGFGLIYFPKFIPDSPAMLLVLAATALIWKKQRLGLAAVLLSTGLLMKPTSVIVLGLLLLSRTWASTLLFAWFPLLGSLTLTVLYYVFGTKWIQQLAGGESFYRIEPQNPWQALLSFFSSGTKLWDLFLQGLGFYGALPVLLIFSFLPFVRSLQRLWLVLGLQVFAIAVLDGEHSFVHQYYFLGTLPVLCLLLQAVLEDLPEWGVYKLARFGLYTLIFGSSMTYLAYEWRPFYITAPADRFLAFGDCQQLKAKLPDWPWHQNHVFRVTPRAYPLVGLCFAERVGSEQSQYGLFVDSDPLPAECEIVQSAGHLRGALCKSH